MIIIKAPPETIIIFSCDHYYYYYVFSLITFSIAAIVTDFISSDN